MIKRDGFSTIQFLISLMFLSMIFTAVYICSKSSYILLIKEKLLAQEEIKIDNMFNNIINDLKNDNKTESDSYQDSIWTWNKKEIDNLVIHIESLDGKININSMPKELLLSTNLKNYFINGDNSVLELYESDSLFYSYEKLSDYISEDVFNKYFTTYGWFNYNFSDKNKTQTLLDALSVNSTAFINNREELKINKQVIHNYAELKLVTGTSFQECFPYINLESLLNVNIVDEDLLKEILQYGPFKIKSPILKYKKIIETRASIPITKEILSSILETDSNNLIFSLLGTKSLFYKIEIKGVKRGIRFVIAREIDDIDISNSNYKWFLIEKSHI